MDMKEIILPYSEYKEMLDLIEKQDKALRKIKGKKGIIVIDNRHETCGHNYLDGLVYSIPKISGEDDAKIFLKEEFNKLSEVIFEVNREIEKQKSYNKKKDAKKYWWQ